MAKSHDDREELEEPKSPLWLPALGGALFLAAGIWWLATNKDDVKPPPTADEIASAAAAASASAAASAGAAADAGAAPAPNERPR